MAECDKNKILENTKDKLPSNEELIESLVKGVEGCLVNDEVKDENKLSTSQSDPINKDENLKDKLNEDIQPTCDKSKEINGEVLESGDGESKTADSNEDDFIDEDHLKDLEVDYSEEDKLRLKGEAEELKNEGNVQFKGGEYKEAVLSYTKALRICPLAFSKNRAILYSNRGAAKIKLCLNESAIEDCTKAVELDPHYLKAYVRRAQLYEDTDKLDEALADYKKILEIDPLHRDALLASKRLPEQINERNEKLKTEMLGKLKDLGNMFLKPFGLSTNNFQMVQDPNSGGYSINFTQNPNHS